MGIVVGSGIVNFGDSKRGGGLVSTWAPAVEFVRVPRPSFRCQSWPLVQRTVSSQENNLVPVSQIPEYRHV